MNHHTPIDDLHRAMIDDGILAQPVDLARTLRPARGAQFFEPTIPAPRRNRRHMLTIATLVCLAAIVVAAFLT